MNSFAEKSLPPSDRDEIPEPELSGDTLRAAIRATAASNSEVAKKIGMSSATISLWLGGKYSGDVPLLESRLRAHLRNRQVESLTGIATIDTEITRRITAILTEIRSSGELGVIIAPAGTGKSRAINRYSITDPLAVIFRVLAWHTGQRGMGQDLARAAGITRREKGKTLWESIIEKSTGSDRLLIGDDMHELGPRGLQCFVDFHDETGCPGAMFGTESLTKKLFRDARRSRRVGAFYELKIENPLPLLEHMVNQLAPDANGEHDQLVDLCHQVVTHSGAFGAVEKQLQYAKRSRRRSHESSWVKPFTSAQQRLLRNWKFAGQLTTH